MNAEVQPGRALRSCKSGFGVHMLNSMSLTTTLLITIEVIETIQFIIVLSHTMTAGLCDMEAVLADSQTICLWLSIPPSHTSCTDLPAKVKGKWIKTFILTPKQSSSYCSIAQGWWSNADIRSSGTIIQLIFNFVISIHSSASGENQNLNLHFLVEPLPRIVMPRKVN